MKKLERTRFKICLYKGKETSYIKLLEWIMKTPGALTA
jgi:hypothetical protein